MIWAGYAGAEKLFMFMVESVFKCSIDSKKSSIPLRSHHKKQRNVVYEPNRLKILNMQVRDIDVKDVKDPGRARLYSAQYR